jgi:hypothetical protein
MNKKIKELIKLSIENPDLEIKIMVNEEVVPGDDHTYWMAEISKIEKEVYWIKDDQVFIGDDDICDYIALDYVDNGNLDKEDRSIDEDNFIDRRYTELKVAGEIEDAIIVYVEV